MTPSGFPGKQPFMSGRFHILSDGVSRWRAAEKAGKPLQQTYKKRCSRHNVILVILDSTSSKGAGISYLDGVKNCTLRHRATWGQCARTRSSPICGNSAIYGGIYKGAPVTVNFLGASFVNHRSGSQCGSHTFCALWSGAERWERVASVELLQPASSVLTREPLKFEWLRFLKVLHGVP